MPILYSPAMESTPGRCHCERCSRPCDISIQADGKVHMQKRPIRSNVEKGPPHIVICPAIAVQHAEHPGGSQLPNFPCALGRYREGRYGHIAIFGCTTNSVAIGGKPTSHSRPIVWTGLKQPRMRRLGSNGISHRNLQTLLCIRRQLRSLILQPLARRGGYDPP